MSFSGRMLLNSSEQSYSYTATPANLPFVRMLRICKISGEELPAISTENICYIHEVKRALRDLHCFPVCLQRLLHKGNRLYDSTKLESLQGGNHLDGSVQPDLPDAPIQLQLVLVTASTQFELSETDSVFHDACRCGKLESAQLLLKAGANKDWQDYSSRTALMKAACEGHTQIAEMLLRAGAHKDLQDHSGRTALMEAASEGHTQTAEMLLRAGAHKDLRTCRITLAGQL